VTNVIPLGGSLFLPVGTVNSVQTLKAVDEKSLQPIREFIASERIAKTGGSRAAFKYDLSVFGLDEPTLRERFSALAQNTQV
jgi:hypothetical protein